MLLPSACSAWRTRWSTRGRAGAAVRAGGRRPLPAGTLLGVPTPAAAGRGARRGGRRRGRPSASRAALRGRPGGDVALGALLRERFGDEWPTGSPTRCSAGSTPVGSTRWACAATLPALRAPPGRAPPLTGAADGPRRPASPAAGAAAGCRVCEAVLDRLPLPRAAAAVAPSRASALSAPSAPCTADADGWRLVLGPTQDRVL